MNRINRELAEDMAEELNVLLGAWYANREDGSVHTQQLRRSELAAGERIMQSVIEEREDGLLVVLAVGGTAIEGTRFIKGAYDMYGRRHVTIKPGSRVPLERAERWTHTVDNPLEPTLRNTLYAGDIRVMVSIDEIAIAVSKTGDMGGGLEVVEKV